MLSQVINQVVAQMSMNALIAIPFGGAIRAAMALVMADCNSPNTCGRYCWLIHGI